MKTLDRGHGAGGGDARLAEDVTPADGFELVVAPTNQYQAAEAMAQLKDACPREGLEGIK